MIRMLVIAAAMASLPLAASANDTTAQFGNAGLVFTKTDSIEMRAEELFISQARVRVQYRFFNKASHDQTLRVAFPLPDMTSEYAFSSISVPTAFHVKVDGRPVAVELEQKVMAGGAERSALLAKYNLPIDPAIDDLVEILTALPKEAWRELADAGVVEIEPDVDGDLLRQNWTLTTTYHWEQTFPAGREIVVEHDYQPSVGHSPAVSSIIGPHGESNLGWPQEAMQKYCIDTAFLTAVDRAAGSGRKPDDVWHEKYIDYVLTTGANWSGPIGSFHLVVDKGLPDNFVSFCAEGVKKISATAFEVRKTNFIPKEDLHILIVKKFRTPADPTEANWDEHGYGVPNGGYEYYEPLRKQKAGQKAN